MILILDFGSQYTQLIARRIREFSVYAEIYPGSIPLEDALALQPRGIILSGGPASVLEADSVKVDSQLLDTGIPILGICYGHQLISHTLGGSVQPADNREYGLAEVTLTERHPLFEGIPETEALRVWMSHGDHVISVPDGFDTLAVSPNSPNCVIAHTDKPIFGFQFHPEVSHTEHGKTLLKNFCLTVCRAPQNWTMAHFVSSKCAEIQETVQTENVLCAMSGGVDSGVTAALLHKALGSQLICVFVDNGLLRKQEKEAVNREFKENLGLNLIVIDAAERFLQALKGETDAEQKRKIIGREFIAVFEEEALTHPNVTYLAQGTLYPDLIESRSIKGPSAVIKSHHNVGGLPEKMSLKIIEPLNELFKDEVRELGLELGLSEQLVFRHPFPGPGLAVRIPGEVTREKLEIVREADAIIYEEMKRSGFYRKVWQAFAVLLPVKSVGVMGDQRTYEWAVSFRCVDSLDAMTANWSELPHDLLATVSSRIINEVKGVNRTLYDITSKPPGTIEWE